MLTEKSIIHKDPNIVYSLTDGKYVLVPLVNNMANMNVIHTLNEVGTFIWDQIDNKRTFKDLLDCIVLEYSVSEDAARLDLTTFLEELRNKKAVTYSE